MTFLSLTQFLLKSRKFTWPRQTSIHPKNVITLTKLELYKIFIFEGILAVRYMGVGNLSDNAQDEIAQLSFLKVT